MTLSMNSKNNNTIAVGKYHIASLSNRLDDGQWRASVSIRSGRGSATTDRVMRLHGSFDSPAAAHRFARQQGLIWVSQTRRTALAG